MSVLTTLSTFIIALVAICILSYLIYLLFAYLIIPPPFQRIGPDEMSLSKLTQVITSEELKGPWTSNSGSTLLFYINPQINDRTGFSGNEYAKAVQIGSKQSFKILVAPDAGRGLSMPPALFEIYVKGYVKPEVVEIPNFSLQKWTTVIIVKQGRRFNIYLNGILSVSHMCTAMPDFDPTATLQIGDTRLGGVISLMSLAPYALQSNEIRDILTRSVDSSGKPYAPMNITSLFGPLIPSLPAAVWCPGGNCKTPKKARPMEEWSSPYA